MIITKRALLFFITVFMLAGSCLYGMDNPFHYDTGINDCDVVKYNGEYYITGNWLGGDMYQSRNLSDWGQRKHIFTWDNTWYTADNEIPTKDIHGTHIAYDNGVFHLYAHLGSDIVYAVSDNVTGPYYEPYDAAFDTSTIDADTFKDEDGTLYYYSTRFGGVSHNHNDYRTMSDYSTLTSSPTTLIWPTDGWEINPEQDYFVSINPKINEGSFVFKYRNKYYMLYNANHTGDTSYALGCVVADSPTGFSNSGKQPEPILNKTVYNDGTTDQTIYTIGQPWLVDGLNGFEKWIGYFAKDTMLGSGRTQRIDRVHFLDREFYVDGPTNRYTPGYHPGPAEPQLRSLFYLPDGAIPSTDWTKRLLGTWQILDNQAYQSDQSTFSFNVVNRDSATNYLFEANVRMPQVQDQEDKVGVIAYFKNPTNWVTVGLDRSLGYGADNWYCQVRTDSFNSVVRAGSFNGTLDYSVYHKIRVERNGAIFRVWIDDELPPNFANIDSGITEPGVPGIFSDHAAALFDGVVYTIGWDECDSEIRGWGDAINDSMSGSWSVSSTGLSVSSGSGSIYKGDLMPTYEFSTHIYKTGTADGVMGAIPVVIDPNNFLEASFDLVNDALIVGGVADGIALTNETVSVPDKEDYNLRAVKLPDCVKFFVDGLEVLTYDISFGDSQVGLFAENMDAGFNGILVYRTEADSLPSGWSNTDIGDATFEGSAGYNEGTFAINASGYDIWSTSDDFHYVYQAYSGDGEIIARLVSQDYPHEWCKSGVMFRDGLDSDAAMVMLTHCGQGRLQLNWREDTGSTALQIQPPDYPYDSNIWLKLQHSGTAYSAYYSYDGLIWTYIGTCTPGFDEDNLKVGMAVCSHHVDRINGAVFDNVSINTSLDLSIPAAPAGLSAIAGDGYVALDWSDNTEADLACYTVYRSVTSGSGYSLVASELTSSEYLDDMVENGVTYYYVVTSSDTAPNESLDSSEVSATPLGIVAATLSLETYYEFENDVSDSTGNLNNAVATGSPVYASGIFGQAIEFDGVDDYLTLPTDIANYDDITVAAWVKWDGGNDWQRIFDFGNNTTEYMCLTPLTTRDTLCFAISVTSNDSGQQLLEADPLPTDQWVHVAVTLDGDIGTMYVNGEVVDSETITLNPTDFYPLYNYIGKSNWNDPLLSGKVDDFRIYNYALNSTEIADLAGMIAHYVFDSDADDSSGHNNDIVATGSPEYSVGRIDQSIVLDGVDDYLTLPTDIANYDDITIATWVRWNGGNDWQRIFDFGNNTTEYLYMTPLTNRDTLCFGITITSNGSGIQLLESTPLPTGEWVHVAVTLNGDIGTMYVNGSVVDSETITLNPTDFNPLYNYIGESQWNDPLFDGQIDDFRIYNYALSSTEIVDLASMGGGLVFSDSFEVAEWDGNWIEDNQNDWFISTQRAVDGTYSAELDGDALNATLTSIDIDLQGISNATIMFSWLIESSLESNDFIAFDISTDCGETWVQKALLQGNYDMEGVWQDESIDLTGITSGSLKIRFVGTLSQSNEDVNVDMVEVITW